jgi:putative transport protein
LAKLFGISIPVAVGLYCGATTNTPSLAAATAAIQDSSPETTASQLPSIGYAIAYPGGVLGIIVCMMVLKWLLKADPAREALEREAEQKRLRPQLDRLTLRVTNPNLIGKTVQELLALTTLPIVIRRSRILGWIGMTYCSSSGQSPVCSNFA